MTIQFHCGHCGKMVEAPDEAGGRRGKCPYCKGSNYIPSADAGEELELAPLDETEERLRKQEIATLMEAEKALISETVATETGPRLQQRERSEVKPKDLHHLVINYCLDMANGNLERAATHVDRLQHFDDVNRQAVDDFISGRVLEPALDSIPVRVLQGFLRNLLADLR